MGRHMFFLNKTPSAFVLEDGDIWGNTMFLLTHLEHQFRRFPNSFVYLCIYAEPVKQGGNLNIIYNVIK